MNDLSRGQLLLSTLLSPLAMADWLLDVSFELSSYCHSKHTVNTSLSLLPGEETIFFNGLSQSQHNLCREVVGRAQLLDVSADEVKIAFQIQERLDDGGWRTILAKTLSTGLNMPILFESENTDLEERVKLQIEIMTA
ncbi:hypothetical protein UA32_00420 [Photobacterium angustum]|uniref:Uncharacterized protein n=1 Tax=Photobacterium angustum TaxID=661 RepID=A0ABX5H8J0_PHOAN|nr:hypothetical protein [Photobacterium angustum]KJG40281.1 hypothetical protein UA32_00420 [Photobacterium angustum]PSX12446.1 hypothetical protein C0W27_00095 [Photobacterium angustum]